jgi:AcrR family transcriptional regulator
MQTSQINQRDAENHDLFSLTVAKTRRRLRSLILYLGGLAAFVLAITKLKDPIQEASGISAKWVVLLVAALPLALTFIFEAIPAWLAHRRERHLIEQGLHGKPSRPGYFRLEPYEDNEIDRKNYTRADGAHEIILDWLRKPNEPVMYLTARSGAGKTSLLDACVLPGLRESSPRVLSLIVRSFRDPVDELRKVLLEPDQVWKHPPPNQQDTRQLLEKACQKLYPTRLLLVFDQFEELLIIHDREPERLQETRLLLTEIAEKPIANLNILIVTRSDYIGKLQDLELPPMIQNRNWKELSPFPEQAARDFIANSGLEVGPRLMDNIITQAEEIEETKGLIRPITLNFIGVILSHISSTSSTKVQGMRRVSNLLLNYLRESINFPEVRDYARPILRRMITHAGTKQPKSVAELSERTGFNKNAVTGCLLNLSTQGVVRRIDEKGNVWEISHDFVARLLSHILSSWRRTLWQKMQPWLAPAALLSWAIILLLAMPLYRNYEISRAKDTISQHGGRVFKLESGGMAIEFSSGIDLAPALGSLNLIANIQQLDLSYTNITDAGLERLKGLNTLQQLYLRGTTITDAGLERLKGLNTLQQLDLSGTTITDAGLERLRELRNLQRLELYRTNTTKTGREKLQQEIPGLKIMPNNNL